MTLSQHFLHKFDVFHNMHLVLSIERSTGILDILDDLLEFCILFLNVFIHAWNSGGLFLCSHWFYSEFNSIYKIKHWIGSYELIKQVVVLVS